MPPRTLRRIYLISGISGTAPTPYAAGIDRPRLPLPASASFHREAEAGNEQAKRRAALIVVATAPLAA